MLSMSMSMISKAGQVARGWDPGTAAVAQKLMMISLGIDVNFGLVSDD